MAGNYSILKAAIEGAVVWDNGENQITGNIMLSVLLSIINSLGAEFQFGGVVVPTDNPGTPDYNVAYIAGPGVYPNFGPTNVPGGYIGVFKYNGEWSYNTFRLVEIVNGLSGGADKVLSAQQGVVLNNAIQAVDSAAIARDAALGGRIDAQDAEISQFEEAVQDQVDNYPMVTIEGNVTNAPDQEDITTDENNLLKFANRSALFGKGYVILRRGKTFAEQVTLQNTIYEIRYDFDLGGASVTIPGGCVLNFVGGSLTNGTISGTQTRLISPPVQIFGSTLTTSGTWIISEAAPEWFGAVANDLSVDCAIAINKAVSLVRENEYIPTFVPCVLQAGIYYTQSTILLDGGKILKGTARRNSLICGATNTANPIVKIVGSSNEIVGLTIWAHSSATDDFTRNGIELGTFDGQNSATRGVIRDVMIQRCNIAMAMYHQWCNAIDGIRISNCKIGVYVGNTQAELSNCAIENCIQFGVDADGALGVLAIYGSTIEGNYVGVRTHAKNTLLSGCYFEANTASSIDPNAEKTGQGADVYGGHIIAGANAWIGALTIAGCFFSNSVAHNNDVYVDKCKSLNVLCAPSEIIFLKTTKNTTISQLPENTQEVIYHASSVQRKSNAPFFSLTDFSQLVEAANNSFVLLDANYLRMYSANAYLQVTNGVLESYRTTDNSTASRRIEAFIRKEIYKNFKHPVLVFDYEINNVNATLVLTVALRVSGSDVTVVQRAPSINQAPGRRQRLIVNFDEYGYSDLSNTTYIDCRMYLNNDAFVSTADDLSDSKSFKLYGLYLYDGDCFDYDGNNIFNEFSRHISDRYVARVANIFVPQDSRPAVPEKGMVIFNDATHKLELYNGSAWVNLDGTAL